MVLDKRMVVEVSASYDMTSFDPDCSRSRRRCARGED